MQHNLNISWIPHSDMHGNKNIWISLFENQYDENGKVTEFKLVLTDGVRYGKNLRGQANQQRMVFYLKNRKDAPLSQRNRLQRRFNGSESVGKALGESWKFIFDARDQYDFIAHSHAHFSHKNTVKGVYCIFTQCTQYRNIKIQIVCNGQLIVNWVINPTDLKSGKRQDYIYRKQFKWV